MAKKILIVEDDIYTRDLYKEVFEEAGFEVDVAADGQEGLTKARMGGYNLILLDVMMPNLDGLGFLKGLKEKPAEVANGSIILLTNLGHDPVVAEAMANGAKTYMVKADVNPGELVEKASKYL